MKLLNQIKILGLVLFISSYSFGQTKLTASELSSEWKLISSLDGIEFYVRKGICEKGGTKIPFEYSFLKIVNTTSTAKTVSYNYVHHFDEACSGCDPNSESSFNFEIAPNSSLEGDCLTNYKGFTGFIKNPSFENGWNFEAVEIRYLKIK